MVAAKKLIIKIPEPTSKEQVEEEACHILWLAFHEVDHLYSKAEPERELTKNDTRVICREALSQFLYSRFDPETKHERFSIGEKRLIARLESKR